MRIDELSSVKVLALFGQIVMVDSDFWSKKADEISASWAVLEIVNGKLNWVWKAEGQRGAPNIISTSRLVADNKWHTVKLSLRKVQRGGNWEIKIDEKTANPDIVQQNVGTNTDWARFLHDSAVIFGGKFVSWPTCSSKLT